MRDFMPLTSQLKAAQDNLDEVTSQLETTSKQLRLPLFKDNVALQQLSKELAQQKNACRSKTTIIEFACSQYDDAGASYNI